MVCQGPYCRVWTPYLVSCVIVWFLTVIVPPGHWLAILGFMIGEELQSCLRDVYKEGFLDL